VWTTITVNETDKTWEQMFQSVAYATIAAYVCAQQASERCYPKKRRLELNWKKKYELPTDAVQVMSYFIRIHSAPSIS
jgi:conjugal transfer/entry exclusion protein